MRGITANGNQIRELRKSFGFTQEELAKRASCDVKTIRKAEKGGRVDLRTLSRIATALQVTSADVAMGADNSHEKETVNVQTVLAWHDAFNRRDVDAILECWHDDGVLQIPGTDDIPAGGSVEGKDEIRAHTETTFQVFDTEHLSWDMMQISAVDDLVFVRGEASVMHIPTGRAMRSYVVHVFRLVRGKIIEQLISTDTRAFQQLVHDDENTGSNEK